MARTKIVAILLGPSGVGLVGLYSTAMSLVETASGMGIGSSGVREIAEAHGSGDAHRVARTAKVLRRACWVTGAAGWLLTGILAIPLSHWAFGSTERAGLLALLGVTLLLNSLRGGQMALLQGIRRIGDLARLNVISAVASTAVALGLYAWLGEKGIVPVLIVTAGVNLVLSWTFSRGVQVAESLLTWRDTWLASKRLFSVGSAFMYGAFLAAIVALATRSLILRELGPDANGIYQAAWAISAMFAGFVLNAMGADFYPRLTAVVQDAQHVNRLVNEQTEIGILLALPGLLGTLAFAPLLMSVFYSAKFLPGAELLPWFVLGVFGRVIGWPIGFIQMAKGSTAWLVATHTHSNVVLIVLTVIFLKYLGLPGTAIAFAVLYPVHTLFTLLIARHLTGFRWSFAVLKLLAVSACLVGGGLAVQQSLAFWPGLIAGALLALAGCWFSLRGIALRLGPGHRLVRTALAFSGVKTALRLN